MNDGGDKIDYALAAQDIESVTMAHIHVSPVGENGPVVAWLYPEDAREPEPVPGESDGMLATGTIGETDLTGPLEETSVETLLGGMRGGGLYVNIHTEGNPDGEIRGQILRVTELFDVLSPGRDAAITAE
ncbi:CHRD domain containing protein [Halobacteriales archaeon QS_1_67_19]|nr:MAG: CHRD domain containing protein [Halobacteriales archaeon QS_1_67_19]